MFIINWDSFDVVTGNFGPAVEGSAGPVPMPHVVCFACCAQQYNNDLEIIIN